MFFVGWVVTLTGLKMIYREIENIDCCLDCSDCYKNERHASLCNLNIAMYHLGILKIEWMATKYRSKYLDIVDITGIEICL